MSVFFFSFTDTATTEIYTLSLHDALPISRIDVQRKCAWGLTNRKIPKANSVAAATIRRTLESATTESPDRKSTRLNSSHMSISYAVFCLKKKNKNKTISLNKNALTKLNTT